MNKTDRYDSVISETLLKAGIKHEVVDIGLPVESRSLNFTVDRTSMCRAFPVWDEHASYTKTLALIRAVCGSEVWLSWGVRTDDYLGFEVLIRSDLTR